MKRLLMPAMLAALMFQSAGYAKTWTVFILSGQSNMEGQGWVKELPEELDAPVTGVYAFQSTSLADGKAVDGRGLWAEMRPGMGGGFWSDGDSNHYSARFGPELTFAKRVKELLPDRNIAIIKYSKGGSSLDTLAADRWGSWDPDFRGKGGINQYDHFFAAINHAFAVTDIDGDGEADTFVPGGIVWMQGESDAAYTPEIANGYKTNLKRMMDLFRAAFRADDIPVVIGRISDSGKDADGKVWNQCDIVRKAQQDFVNEDVCAAIVTTMDGYSYSDPYHYDSAGYIDMGNRFAEEMAKLVKK